MTECVIYARVSTKEQADEGYSIDAQLKACRELCEREGLVVVAEFVEAESAGKAGRTQFARCAPTSSRPPGRATRRRSQARPPDSQLHRLTSSSKSSGVRDRFVVSDFPEGPAGVLARDVNLAVAKHYVNNLREEVKKGMAEKVAQGGWPHKAPLWLPKRQGDALPGVDPVTARFVVHAFERYASGLVSLSRRSPTSSTRWGCGCGRAQGLPLQRSTRCSRTRSTRVGYGGRARCTPARTSLSSPRRSSTVQEAFAPNRTQEQRAEALLRPSGLPLLR